MKINQPQHERPRPTPQFKDRDKKTTNYAAYISNKIVNEKNTLFV